MIAKRLPNRLRTPADPARWTPELWAEVNATTRVKDWREYIRSWFVDDFLGLPLTESPELPETQYGENPVKPIRFYWMNQNNPIQNDLVTVAQYPFRSLLSTPEFLEFWPGVEDTRDPPTPIETNCNYPRANKMDTYHFNLPENFWNSGKNYTVDLSSLELPNWL